MTHFNFNFDGWDEVVSFARKVIGEADQPKEVHIPPVLPTQPAPVPVSQPVPQPVPAPVQQPVPAPAPQATAVPVPTPVPQPQPVPTAAASYTLDDLARAAMPLMDAGRQADLQQLLVLFGVEALPALQPGQYGAFATKLREMGAQI